MKMKPKVYICPECGRYHPKEHGTKKTCRKCYEYYRSGGIIHFKPSSGEITYSEEGNPICHMCGKAFPQLMKHVKNSHGLTPKEYKELFKLPKGKAIASLKSLEQKRLSALSQKNINPIFKKKNRFQ